MTAEQYAIKAHADTNHMYDTYLPYEFHLRMVVKVANDNSQQLGTAELVDALNACWLHDTIEDTRTNYNDIKSNFGTDVAEIVRACTNYGRGRNRTERMPAECYIDIKTVPGALFVKLCDRIANVQYSKMTGSRMFEMYTKEQNNFSIMLKDDRYPQLWAYLGQLLSNQ